MSHDIETLTNWIRVCLAVAAFFTTSFVVLFASTTWRKYMLGWAVMHMALGFALAIDLTLLFTYWTPKNILLVFWIQATVFTLIALSTATMTYLLWRSNFSGKSKKKRGSGTHAGPSVGQ